MTLRFRNLDLDSFESELKNKSGRKGPRVRLSKSCLECRTRRKRCSRELPCKECHQRGAPSECVYNSTPQYSRPHADPLPSPPDASEANSPEESVSSPPTGPQAGTDSGANTARRYDGPVSSPTVSPATTSSRPDGAASIFQSSGLKTRMIGVSHWMAPCREMLVLRAFVNHSTEFQSIWDAFGELKALFQVCNSVPPSPSLPRVGSDGDGLRTLLPDRARCEEWITKFCQSYNRIYGIIHPAALRDDVQQIYSGSLVNPVHVARAVMAVAIAMQDSETDRMHGRMLAREVEDCISSSLRFQKPCIGAVQNLLLMILLKTISASDTDKMHDMLSLQCLTGQVMFNMGLHRDPAPFPGITPYHAELRKRLWACYLRLSLDFCMRGGTRLSICLDETDCPLPTAATWGSLGGHHGDATPFEQEMTDAAFTVAAAELASIIAPIYRKLYLPKPPDLGNLQKELQPSIEAFVTNLPPPLNPETPTSDPFLALQQSILSISMQSFLAILTFGSTLATAPEPSQRTFLLETWDLATSTTHQFQGTCQAHPSLRPIVHHLLWSHVARAALTACFVIGRLRALDRGRRPLAPHPQQSVRVFHGLLTDSLAAIAPLLRARAHLGPVAAKVNLFVAVALGVTGRLFAEDYSPTSVSKRLFADGVRTAAREIGEMKAKLQRRAAERTVATVASVTAAAVPLWGASAAPGVGGGMGSVFPDHDFLSSSHDAVFGSLVPGFGFEGTGGFMAEFSPGLGQFGGVGFESLWE